MKNLQKILIPLITAFISTVAFAQGRSLSARLMDSSTNEPIPYATASLTPEGAKSASKYVLSTDNGWVEMSGLKKGKYTLKVELLGYKTLTKNIEIGSEALYLGNIAIEPDAQMLDAAKVTDVGNPVTIKKDTVEYNATLFRQSDNDMLIDLLKKLPGVEVDSDGKITANGKEITKITIDGKTFFLDDPQLATKNIPSKIVEKVKVVDRKSEQARFTGIDDGEEETIIDLGIKKGMMKGWFGNLMAGGGHDVPSQNNSMNDWRYQGAGFVGNFSDHQQISVILNGNNTNNRGFNDLAGSMMGGMRGGGRGGFGGDNGGINTSWMGGVNGAWDFFDNRMEFGGNYMYGGNNRLVEEQSLRNTYVNDRETLNYKTDGVNNTFSDGHRIGFRLDHKFNDNTSIFFEPQFNIGRGNYSQNSGFTTDRTFKDGTPGEDVNKGFTDTKGWNNNWNTSGRFLFRQKLGKPGRTMTVNLRYEFSNNKLNGFNQSYTAVENVADPEIVNQRIDQNQSSKSLTGGITYTEPLYKEILFLEANYRYNWRNQSSYKDSYDSAAGFNWDENARTMQYIAAGETKNSTYSNTINNDSQTHRAGLNLMYQNKGLNAQLGMVATPTHTLNETNGQKYLPGNNGWRMNYAPQASLRYEINDNNNLRLNYWCRTNQPSTNQLMPVPDNSDPLRVSLGNPYLEPYFSHSIRSEYRFTNKKTFTSVNAFMDGGITQNPIVNTSWYESDGRQFSLPSNGPDAFNVNLRVFVNSPLGKSKFSIFNMVFVNYNNSSNYIKTGSSLNMNDYYHDGVFDYDKFHTDVPVLGNHSDFSVNLNQTFGFTERFRLTFRNDFVELNAGARTRMSKGWYSVAQGNTNTTWATQVDGSMNWTIPGGINIIADYNYNRYDGYTTPQRDVHMLNAEITKLLFKDSCTLALKAYDLLGQGRNLNVQDTANYHSESVNNTLGRYIILSFTYRFGNFGGKKGGQFTPGGPGGAGGRGGRGGGPGGPRW